MNISTLLWLYCTLHQFCKHNHWTRNQLQEYQAQQLIKLRRHIYVHSPFYQRFHRGLYDSPLNELPILTKQTMMENFDDLVTDRTIRLKNIKPQPAQMPQARYLDQYWVNATSGTTGSPGIYLLNNREWATVLASFVRSYEWARTHVGLTRSRKIAIVSSVNFFDMSYLVGASLRNPWVSILQLSATEPIEEIVHRLNEWQPETLVAYASQARLLAVEQLEKRLHIAPHTIFTTSEILTNAARNLIEQVWGKQLFNLYATTESAAIAAECNQHNGMHLYEDRMIVENVDSLNRPVPLGMYGDKLLITLLFNRTQPLIRYELNDSMRFIDTVCACGRPFLLMDNIQGRVEEELHFPSGAAGQVTIPPHVLHEVMERVEVRAWQIIHKDKGLYLLLDVPQRSSFDEKDLVVALSNTLSRHWVIVPKIYVEYVDNIPRTLDGKAPLIQSETTSTIM